MDFYNKLFFFWLLLSQSLLTNFLFRKVFIIKNENPSYRIGKYNFLCIGISIILLQYHMNIQTRIGMNAWTVLLSTKAFVKPVSLILKDINFDKTYSDLLIAGEF